MNTASSPTALPRMAYRINEAAEIIAVSTALIYLWRRQNKIKLTKIGGRTVIMAEELRRFLAENAKTDA